MACIWLLGLCCYQSTSFSLQLAHPNKQKEVIHLWHFHLHLDCSVSLPFVSLKVRFNIFCLLVRVSVQHTHVAIYQWIFPHVVETVSTFWLSTIRFISIIVPMIGIERFLESADKRNGNTIHFQGSFGVLLCNESCRIFIYYLCARMHKFKMDWKRAHAYFA